MSEKISEKIAAPSEPGFVVDLEGFEGPLDLLLLLAREQKVDMRTISILALAEQYLAFIEEARRTQLDLAAEYLVMAAWLAYLKSRLLLPKEEESEETLDARLQAEILAWRLARLQAMRDASDKLMGQPRLGVDLLPRGKPEGIRLIRSPIWQDNLYDLARAYALHKAQKNAGKSYRVERRPIMTVEQAYKILAQRLHLAMTWEALGKMDAARKRRLLSIHFSQRLRRYADDGQRWHGRAQTKTALRQNPYPRPQTARRKR